MVGWDATTEFYSMILHLPRWTHRKSTSSRIGYSVTSIWAAKIPQRWPAVKLWGIRTSPHWATGHQKTCLEIHFWTEKGNRNMTVSMSMSKIQQMTFLSWALEETISIYLGNHAGENEDNAFSKRCFPYFINCRVITNQLWKLLKQFVTLGI